MATAPAKLVLFLLLTAVSAAAFAQRPSLAPLPEPPSPPQITPNSSAAPLKVTTQLTLENVTVTDAAGKPVLGLKPSDFSIKEDGKLRNVKNFEEYSAVVSSHQSVPPALPPHVYTNAQSPGFQSGAVNILLLDTLNTGPARQAYVRIKAISYLQNMPPGTEVAIFELGSELRVVQGFTADRAVLLAAMNSIHPATVINQYAVKPSIPPIAQLGLPTKTCPICDAIQQACTILNRRSDATLEALDAIAAFGSGIKGRKNLLWFTTGQPQITAYQWVYNFLNAMQPPLSSPPTLVDYTPNLQRAYGLLAAAQVAIYPIDPRGLIGGGSQAGDVAELSIGDSMPEEDPQYQRNSFSSMQDMAANTGGLAYYNRNDLDNAIGEAIDSGAHSYSLSYVPPSSKYGQFHKIEIAVDRPGLHLHYREGYTAVDLSKSHADNKTAGNAPAPDSAFHSAVDRGMIPSTDLQFDLRVTPSTAPIKPGDPPVAGMLNANLKGKPLVRYALTYEVPAGEVTLVDGPDGTRRGSIEFDAVAYDEDGVKLNVVRETANFTLKPNEVEHFAKNPVLMPVQIDLPAGKLDLHAGVLDASSRKMGTLEIPETVASKQ